MTIRVGINGLGRIGRCVVRSLYEYSQAPPFGGVMELIAVNGPAPVETHAHLIKYDSVHGRAPFNVSASGENLAIGDDIVQLFRHKDPAQIPWGNLDVDIVFECSGKFNSKAEAVKHLAAGAKKVLISAPAEDMDATIVYGVNNAMLKKEHKVVSVGSCTTNALAPLVKVLHDAVGIESGFMTTIHAYTGDQNLVDNSHKDLRRARAASLSMIPTSTGAAKTIGLIVPELKGRLDGTAIRVPVPNVSLVDLAFTAGRDITKNDINDALRVAADGSLKGILHVSGEPLVSVDFTHTPYSAVADLGGSFVTGSRLGRAAAWYDNEWGFSCRMLDVARLWASL